MDEILQKIKSKMTEKGLTIFKLTEQTGLSENTIYNWYNRGAEPSIHALQSVCQVLGISLSELFCENELETLTLQESQLIEHFRNLTESKRKIILKLVKDLE